MVGGGGRRGWEEVRERKGEYREGRTDGGGGEACRSCREGEEGRMCVGVVFSKL